MWLLAFMVCVAVAVGIVLDEFVMEGNRMQRIQTVLQSVVTWLGVAVVALTVAAEQLADVLPAAWIGYAIAGAAILAAVIEVIRRVTPVLPTERGLLPQGDNDE